MGKIRKFEDIEAWQKARELTRQVYEITNKSKFTKDYYLKDQIRRASVSIMLNIAEGFARKTNKEFARFLTQAHGSAAEVQSVLYVALDQNYMTQDQFDFLYSFVEKISKMIMNFTLYLTKGRQK